MMKILKNEVKTMANKFYDFDEPINRIGTDSFKWDYEGEF